jgi:hypothetical protein
MEPLTAKEARRRRSTRHPALCRDCQQISTQPSERNASWMSAHATPVANQMTLAPALGPIGGIRPGLVSRTHRPHRATIHDRSRPINWSLRANQSSRAKCIRSQMPACCQSRRRRQHVIPEPQPSSCGNICHGMPLRRTKRMPVRHARPILEAVHPQAPKHPSTQAPKHFRF